MAAKRNRGHAPLIWFKLMACQKLAANSSTQLLFSLRHARGSPQAGKPAP